MFLLTVLDGSGRSLVRRVDAATCVDPRELPGFTGDRGVAWCATTDGARVRVVTLDGAPIADLAPGERAAVAGLVLCVSSDDVADPTRRIVRARRRATPALRLPDGRVFPLGEATLIVGADASCDVVLDDPAVSGRHCEVVPHDDAWAVWDLGSVNGLWVDRARVPFAVIDVGAALVIGRTRVECVGGEAPAREASVIVGACASVERVRAEIARVAEAPYAVLIEGESGAGKELVAREIHARSPRRNGPLVTVNCGAIAADLIESELFGHERGAFTGASARRRGVFEEANGGTLFLDEIGELPLGLQPKLLRVLETGEARRVGAESAMRVDVRVVSATLRDLEQRVAEGTFRQDLFFRLQDFRIRVPPLRDRRADIPALAESLLARVGRETGRWCRLEDEALACLLTWHWPGNVRELFAVLKRAVFAAPGGVIGAEHVGLAPVPYARRTTGVREAVSNDDGDGAARPWPDQVPRGDLAALLAWCGGNVSRVSVITGLARSTVRARLARGAAQAM